VSDLFGVARLTSMATAPWLGTVRSSNPGVYIVARTANPDIEVNLPAEIDHDAVEHLLRARPKLRIDGVRPSVEALAIRLAAMGYIDETVVYVGLAGTSLETRIGDRR
jgi:hypothetical protein